jgi:toxin YoeB
MSASKKWQSVPKIVRATFCTTSLVLQFLQNLNLRQKEVPEAYCYLVKIEATFSIKNCSVKMSVNEYVRLGKPEPLKNSLKGYWSRRITDEHRLVYKVDGKKGVDQRCAIVQCKFHYDDK